MFLLKKIFNLRENQVGSSEKPFLDHLDDLRAMITRIVFTLLIATIGSYIFKDSLMDVLRRPIEVVWEDSQQEKLPTTITPELWEKAKLTALHAESLAPAQRDQYFNQFTEEQLPFYAQCAHYYRIAMSIDTLERQQTFIDQLDDVPKKVKDTTKELLVSKPNAKPGAKNNVVYMRSLKPTETFMLSLKLAFFAGVIIAFPFILYFILQFILPGLKENERKAMWPALFIGFGLFLGGVFFCYFQVLPKALDFFYTYSAGMGVENEWRIGDYITFATQFTLIFGLAFELPVVVMTFVKIGLLDYATMSRTRSYAIVAIFVVAAVITPTGDALTLCMLSAPMCILYEICIWLAYFSNKKERARELEELAEVESLAPRIAAPVGTVSAQFGEDDDEEQEDEIKYEDYFSGSADQQTDDEGDEIDDGELPNDDSDADDNLAFGHEADASDLYDPYEIDFNPGASVDTDLSDSDESDDDDIDKSPPHN